MNKNVTINIMNNNSENKFVNNDDENNIVKRYNYENTNDENTEGAWLYNRSLILGPSF